MNKKSLSLITKNEDFNYSFKENEKEFCLNCVKVYRD